MEVRNFVFRLLRGFDKNLCLLEMNSTKDMSAASSTTGTTVDAVISEIQSMLHKTAENVTKTFFEPIGQKLDDMECKLNNLENDFIIIKANVRQIQSEYRELTTKEETLSATLEQYQCRLCMTDTKEILVRCGHSFCNNCMEETRKQIPCPICRQHMGNEIRIRL